MERKLKEIEEHIKGLNIELLKVLKEIYQRNVELVKENKDVKKQLQVYKEKHG